MLLGKLKLLFKDTVIYGTSTILARSLNYLLVPLYANQLSTFDNGIQTLVYANIAIANVIFSYGLETSYLKTASDAIRLQKDERGLFSTAFISLFTTATLFTAILFLLAPSVSSMIGLSPAEQPFIRYAAVILWIDTLLVIPFAELRLKRQAVRFAVARIAGVVAVVISAFILLGPLQAGLGGAFLSNILGSLLTLILLIPVLRRLRAAFSFADLRDMLRIGLPYVPTGIAGLLIHLIDRNILIRMPSGDIERIYGKGLEASDVVGIYGRVVAFGVVLQLFIQVFRFAWQPFFLQHSSDPDAKRLFRHVLSISTMLTMFMALAATFFVPDLVRYHYGGSLYLLPPGYWIGLSVLPWIFLSYVFDMVSTNLSAGILITGTTRYLPVVTFAGASVTGFFCWWLIPVSGMEGAAYAIVAGTVVMCMMMAYYSLRAYPVQHDWGKLSLLLVGGIGAGWVGMSAIVFLPAGPWVGPGFKIALLGLYVLFSALMFPQESGLLIEKLRGRIRRI
ncbi:MAG: polysaccharide biosynthesis protein [Pelodictyon luteolum]|uniref:Polysaccharide biosynthesis protein n=1 Tax=Pelodictyon luteolum TaxID=1100 RepID=A0A165L633_PELLU|nr:oligosaccharide flippase family protein [Pelodictyon luteolum]KZK73614.1 MAG: polysaccharide biosynthesis protein [Pelodictyon luteolum]